MNNNDDDNKRCRVDYEYINNSGNNNNDNNNNQNEILFKRKANNNRSQIENNNLQNQIIELNNNINILKDTLINNNIIVTLNNNNSDSKDNNNSDNNNSYNKVFNNIFIRRIIFNHLNKFNILYPVNIKFESAEEFQQFKYKEYLHRVSLDFEDDLFELNQLPINIKHITIKQPKKINDKYYEIIQVPDHIESVSYIYSTEVAYVNSLPEQPHSSKIKNLFIECLEEILPNRIPNSVTDLKIYTTRLSNNVLPSNLKKLKISNLESFEDNCLQIESLTHLSIYFSNSLIFHQLSRSFFKNLVILELEHFSKIDTDVQFPDSLKELIINCKSFNYISSQQTNTDKYHPIRFPPSLEKLSIHLYDNDDIYFDSFPPNLKSLEFPFSSIIDNKGQSILPSKLEKLVMHYSLFNQVLQVNQLPPTLNYLNLGLNFNQVIDVKVLPTNLDTLILGQSYSQVINPLAIPQQLKLLEILNYNYSHSINLTPLTHPNTAISLGFDSYSQATLSNYNQIRVLRLPNGFDSPLSTLQLQNKSNLEYLHLGGFFNHPIELSDLPTENNIKTLQLSRIFEQTINLEYFQNLETLIIISQFLAPTIITTTTTIINEQQQQYVHYNNYKLKNIIVSPNNITFLKQLDTNFYQFIKYNK